MVGAGDNRRIRDGAKDDVSITGVSNIALKKEENVFKNTGETILCCKSFGE